MRRVARRHVCLDATHVCLSRQARDVLFRDSVAACGGAIFGGRGALVALTRAAVRSCVAIDGGAIYLAGGQGMLWLERVRHGVVACCAYICGSYFLVVKTPTPYVRARSGSTGVRQAAARIYMWQFLPRG